MAAKRQNKSETSLVVPLFKVNATTDDGRVYSKNVLRKAINRYFKKHEELFLVTDFDKENPSPEPDNAIGYIREKDINFQGDFLNARINFFDKNVVVPFGQLMLTGQIGVSPVGYGVPDENGKVKTYNIIMSMVQFSDPKMEQYIKTLAQAKGNVEE